MSRPDKQRPRPGIVGLLTAGAAGRRRTDAPARLGVVACLLISAAAIAAERQPLADVERAAEAFVAGDAAGHAAEAAPLDRRLNLPRCDRPLEPFLRAGARVQKRTVVGVRCSGSRPWKVYVPVTLAVSGEVLVLKHPLPRGHVLGESDLAVERRDLSRLPAGYATEAAAVVGLRLKHSLRAGAVVTPGALVARTLIRRGQAVTLAAANDAVRIRVAGKALMDGALNQRIRVENSSSGRIVEGIVRSAELVEVLVP